jgi:hypothetical protein
MPYKSRCGGSARVRKYPAGNNPCRGNKVITAKFLILGFCGGFRIVISIICSIWFGCGSIIRRFDARPSSCITLGITGDFARRCRFEDESVPGPKRPTNSGNFDPSGRRRNRQRSKAVRGCCKDIATLKSLWPHPQKKYSRVS